MNLHEYQSKSLLKQQGMPVPNSVLISNIAAIPAALAQFSPDRYKVVAKVQVHSGARGKAGGVVVLPKEPQAITDFCHKFLGQRLVTHQSPSGQPVHHILIEEAADIDREFYVALTLDRARRQLVLIVSASGGMDIEQVAHNHPEAVVRIPLHSGIGIQSHHARTIGFDVFDLKADQIPALHHILQAAYQAYGAYDLTLLEINPLVVTKSRELLCLDAKMTVDESALYRQSVLRDYRDLSQEDPKEAEAQKSDITYIALDGTIGCLVNGAGLAMATMDLIQYAGGQPANFLDVGGGATQERVTTAFKIILQDKRVKAILVNIFGGIVRCDLIAQGIIAAVKEVGMSGPVVVRLQGNLADEAYTILEQSGLNITVAHDLKEAAEKVVTLAGAVK
jgi:succinyl-CoA synthetase beta subunit